MSRQGEIEKCQTQITSTDCNAVMSTRSRDTDRSDMNSLKSSTFSTSSEQPLAQLSESESDDVHTEHINRQTVTASFADSLTYVPLTWTLNIIQTT